MFHTNYIQEENRKFQRFLWWREDGDTEGYEITFLIFGTSSPASAQFIVRKNANVCDKNFLKLLREFWKSIIWMITWIAWVG